MKILAIIILSAVLLIVSVQLYFILKESGRLKADLNKSGNRLQALLKENVDLQSEIEYFSHPENLEKELKSRFNYKNPGEEMMIIVP